MTSPEVSEERLEALLAGAAPATPAEEELVSFMTELRGEPVGAPAGLRARVRALEAAPSRMARLRAALTGPGLRRSMLIAAPACSLALAAGVVIGIGQSPSTAPPAPETFLGSTTATEPRANKPPTTERREDTPAADGSQDAPGPANTPPPATPQPDVGPLYGSGAPTAIEAAPPSPSVSGDSVTAQGSGARVLPDAGTDDERQAAHAAAVADALNDAARKAERAADRAGVKLGPPEAVAVAPSPQVPECAPAAAPAPAGTPTTAPAPPVAPAPAGTCTVAADVSVTYPAQGGGTTTSASPPSP